MTESITFRCPDKLAVQIKAQMATTGRDKTSVVVEFLRLGLEVNNGRKTEVRHEEPEQLQETIESVVEHKMQSVVDNLNGILAEMQSKVREVEERLGEWNA